MERWPFVITTLDLDGLGRGEGFFIGKFLEDAELFHKIEACKKVRKELDSMKNRNVRSNSCEHAVRAGARVGPARWGEAGAFVVATFDLERLFCGKDFFL